MSSTTKVSFTLEPLVHMYKKRKPHVLEQENVYESNDECGSQTGRVQAPAAQAPAAQAPAAQAPATEAPVNEAPAAQAPTPPPTPTPAAAGGSREPSFSFSVPWAPPPPLNLFPQSSSGQGLTISVPKPGAYRAPSASPPGSLTPNTQAEIIREARDGLERERALRKVEEAIRQAAIGLASHAFQREDTPADHLTPHSQRTPASIKSLRSPRIGLHLSPLQLSPMNQSPRVASEAPRIMLRPIAEKNSLSSLSLDSLTLSNEGSFTSLNTMA